MKVAVYLGAHYGSHPSIQKACHELGLYLGQRKDTLVYGGSNTGLMLEIAESVKEAGGKLIGVQLESIHASGRSYARLDELYLYKSLAERKQAMMDLADAFIALPGGVGTLDEVATIIGVNKLSAQPKPVILYNLEHYYDELESLLNRMVEYGYLTIEERKQTSFASSLNEIQAILEQ